MPQREIVTNIMLYIFIGLSAVCRSGKTYGFNASTTLVQCVTYACPTPTAVGAYRELLRGYGTTPRGMDHLAAQYYIVKEVNELNEFNERTIRATGRSSDRGEES